jgi:hypothetical protein
VYLVINQDNFVLTHVEKMVGLTHDVSVIEAKEYKGVVRLPRSVKGIKSRAFEGADIKELIVPRSVMTIEGYSLIGVKKLVLLERENVKGMKLEKNWDKGLRDLIFGDSVKSFVMSVREHLFGNI